MQKVFFGPVTNPENEHVPEIAWNEVAALVPLVVFMVWIGVHPSTFLKKMSPSVKELLSVVKSDSGDKVMVARHVVIPSVSEGPGREGAPSRAPHPPRSLATLGMTTGGAAR